MESLIYVNKDTVTAHCTPTGNGPPRILATLLAQWQARFSFFCTGEDPAAVPGISLRCVLKEKPTGAALLASSTTSLSDATYTFDFASVDSSGLRTLIGDADNIDLQGEIEWTISGRVERVYFPVTLINSRHRPDDVAPDPADEAYELWLTARAVRFDEAQALTDAARIRALENLAIRFTSDGYLEIDNADGDTFHVPLNGRTPTAHTHPQSDITGLTDSLNAKADLIGGKVPSSQIPSIALTEFLGPVSSEAAMILLSGQPGDYCFRTDVGLAYFLTTGTGSSVGNWQAVSTPATSGVVSVNGQDGVVVLGPEDIGLSLPLDITDGGTGGTSPREARLALGIETAIDGSPYILDTAYSGSGVVDIAVPVPSDMYISLDGIAEWVTFWLTDGNTIQPSVNAEVNAGRFVAVDISALIVTPDPVLDEEGNVISQDPPFINFNDAWTALMQAVDNDPLFIYNTSNYTITNAINGPGDNILSSPLSSAAGIAPYALQDGETDRKLPSMDGSKLTNINARQLGGYYVDDFSLSTHLHDNRYPTSLTSGITGADRVTNIVSLTQAEYDALGIKSGSTLYIIA